MLKELAAIAAGVSIMLSGCGTILTVQQANDSGENIKPYSGTRAELENPILAGHGVVIPWILDLPFSLIADSIMLPFVLFQTSANTVACDADRNIGEGGHDATGLTLTVRGKDVTKIHYLRLVRKGSALGPLENCEFVLLSNGKYSKWERRENVTVVEFGDKTPPSRISIERLANGYRMDFSQTRASELCRGHIELPRTIEIQSGQARCRIDHGSNLPPNQVRAATPHAG